MCVQVHVRVAVGSREVVFVPEGQMLSPLGEL